MGEAETSLRCFLLLGCIARGRCFATLIEGRIGHPKAAVTGLLRRVLGSSISDEFCEGVEAAGWGCGFELFEGVDACRNSRDIQVIGLS